MQRGKMRSELCQNGALRKFGRLHCGFRLRILIERYTASNEVRHHRRRRSCGELMKPVVLKVITKVRYAPDNQARSAGEMGGCPESNGFHLPSFNSAMVSFSKL